MSDQATINHAVRNRILQWAVRRHEQVSLTFQRDGDWIIGRSNLLWLDEASENLGVAYPSFAAHAAPLEISHGESLGVSFRRGHKKCVFSSRVTARQQGADGIAHLALACPDELHEYQRRAYQRATVPPGRRIPVLVLRSDESKQLLCAGDVRDISAGGTQIELDAPYDAHMRVGDAIRLEMTPDPRSPALVLPGVFRHASALASGKIAIGIQFRGLEASRDGHVVLSLISRLVSDFRGPANRRTPAEQANEIPEHEG